MVFGIGRRDAREAEDSPKGRVPYKLASYEHDHEGKRFKSSDVVYSFWSASKYVLILSLMLWWLPMFGQMIAGYVGGRRAGGPWKGVAASIIPVVGLYVVMTGFDSGFFPSHVFGVAVAPAAIGASLSTSIPFISPYIQFSSEYLGSFVDALAGSSPYGINTYVLTVAFAYVGGVLAEQNRREIEYTSGAVMNTTTVLVHDPQQHAHMQQGSEHHGVLSAMGAVFHLPSRLREGYADHSAGFPLRRHRDPWAHASEVRYDYPEEVDRRHSLPPAQAGYEYPDLYDERSNQRGRKSSRNQWDGRQKRRGAPNRRSKPRFSYPQYEEHQGASGASRRSGRPQRTASQEPRSARSARRIMDKDWGHSGRRNPRFVDDSTDESDEETEAVAVPRRSEHHHTADQWDSI